jgi:uncharacterized protein YdeI (YjbR/CyaY-like superfamily)
MADDLPRILFETREQFESWMHEHHETAPGVWLIVAKKGAPYPSITRDDLVEVGLMYGWIDGLVNGIDEHAYAQRFTPRRARSVWSQRNVDIVARLTESGRMQPRGQAEVDAAKADGRWDRAYAGQAQPQEDFVAALAAHDGASEFYETLPRSIKFQMYHQIQTAVKPETRAARIEKYVTQIAAGQRPV